MAVTENSDTGNGSTTNYSFTFPYLKSTDVKVQVDQVVTTAWTFANATTVQFNTAPDNGAAIKILRDTNVDNLTATFYAGSAIKSEDLNDNYTQNLYKTQEVGNRSFQTTGDSTMIGNLNMGEDTTIKFEGSTDNAHETTLTVVDPTADRTITLPNITGTVVTTGDTGTVTSTMITDGTIATGDIANNAITEAKIANNSIGSGELKADSVDSEHYIDGSIDTAHIADLQITTGKIAADAVNGTKIADDSINSEHYVDGSIDTAHIADSQVTTAKIANTAVTSDKLATDSVISAKIGTDAVKTAKIEDSAVTHDKIANNAVTTVKITDANVTEAKIANGAIATAKLADNAVTTDKITNDAITNDKIANSAVQANQLATDAVVTAKISNYNVTTGKLADANVTTAKLADNAVTTAKIAGTAVTDVKIASNAVTTSKITDANVTTDKLANDSVTIGKIGCEQTTISDSDSHIPTSGAVVDYVAAQISPIGGLEVIATDAAFPNTQPAAGVVISIADAGGLVVNGSGTSTTGRTVGNSTVTINNIASNFNNSTVDAGVCFQVSSTGSGQVYNYHKATLKEADLLNLSNDINDFGNRYRVHAGEPSSNNDEGDLVYDTNANKMKVYDGSTWGEVTSTGDFKYLFLCPAGGSGAPTIDGSIATYDLRESSNSGSAASVTSAAQLLVSINGVVQKANTGTSAPAEGFALVDSNTIIFGSNLASGSSVFIVQFGSALTINTPGDGTVSAAKIASGAVTTAKIADDAVTSAKIADASIDEARLQISNSPTNGQFLSAQSGNTGGLTWADGASEGTSVKSTGESGGTKYLREDGDGTCSWQSIPAGVGGATGADFNDNTKLRFGTGNDLEIYHNATNSIINNTTGELSVQADQFSVRGEGWSENMIIAVKNSYVRLYHDNTKRLETSAYGITVDGTVTATAFSGSGASITGVPGVPLLNYESVRIGTDAGTNFTSGIEGCVVIGSEAGEELTTGINNTCVGLKAMRKTTTANSNVAVGSQALMENTTGSRNVAVGHYALDYSLTDNDNIAIGYWSQTNTRGGSNNVAIGSNTLKTNVSGGSNVAIGTDALEASGTGASNTAVGYYSMTNTTSGGYNTGIGHKALETGTTHEHNVAIGHEAGQDMTTGYYNTLVGNRSGTSITTGGYHVAIGMDSLKAVTTSNSSVAVGYNAGNALTSGTQFTAIGYEAGKTNSTAGYMTAVGYRALKTANGSSGNAEELTAVGAGCLENNTTGQYNTAVGSYALNTLTDGSSNIAIGKSAGYDCNSTGNLLIGVNAGDEITSGNFNICLGYQTGSNTTDLTTGNKNILLGAYCHTSAAGGGNQVVMGYNVSGKGDNTLYCDQNPYHLGNSTSWSTTSDRRIKKNIVDNTVGLDAINQIRVRNFEYRTEDEITEIENTKAAVVKIEGVQVGCIAQELETVLPSAVNTNEHDIKSVVNDPIIWALVNAVKELSAEIKALKEAA